MCPRRTDSHEYRGGRGMSLQGKKAIQLLLWGVSAGLVSFPAGLAAQAESGRPPGTLGAWIEEARARSFHASTLPGTPKNPARQLAAGPGTGDAGALRHPLAPMPDSTGVGAQGTRLCHGGGDLPSRSRDDRGWQERVGRGRRFRAVGGDDPGDGGSSRSHTCRRGCRRRTVIAQDVCRHHVGHRARIARHVSCERSPRRAGNSGWCRSTR